MCSQYMVRCMRIIVRFIVLLESLSKYFKLTFFDDKDHERGFSVGIYNLHPPKLFFYKSICKLLNLISLQMRKKWHTFKKVNFFILSSLFNPHQALLVIVSFYYSQVAVLNCSNISCPGLIRVQGLFPKRLPTGKPNDLCVPLFFVSPSIFSDVFQPIKVFS